MIRKFLSIKKKNEFEASSVRSEKTFQRMVEAMVHRRRGWQREDGPARFGPRGFRPRRSRAGGRARRTASRRASKGMLYLVRSLENLRRDGKSGHVSVNVPAYHYLLSLFVFFSFLFSLIIAKSQESTLFYPIENGHKGKQQKVNKK